MKKVVLDTNFLLIPAQFRVDIFEEIRRICSFEHELVVLDKSIEELKRITREQKGRNKAAAKMALELVIVKKIRMIRSKEEKSADDMLAELSGKGFIIATQDKELKRRLKKPIIVLRQKKYLQLIN